MKNACSNTFCMPAAFTFSAKRGKTDKVDKAPTWNPFRKWKWPLRKSENKPLRAQKLSITWFNASGKPGAGFGSHGAIEQAGYLLESQVKRRSVRQKRATFIAKLDPAEAAVRLEKAQIALRNAKADTSRIEVLGYWCRFFFQRSGADRLDWLISFKAKNLEYFWQKLESRKRRMNFERLPGKAPISGQISRL